MFGRGVFGDFYVIEITVQPWNPEDPRNRGFLVVSFSLSLSLSLSLFPFSFFISARQLKVTELSIFKTLIHDDFWAIFSGYIKTSQPCFAFHFLNHSVYRLFFLLSVTDDRKQSLALSQPRKSCVLLVVFLF